MDPGDRFTGQNMLLYSLKTLKEANLITSSQELEELEDPAKKADISFAITPLLGKVTNALGLSLSALAATDPSQRIIATPIPQRAFSSRYLSDVLVLMPFADQLLPVYEDHLKAVTTRLRLSIARSDDFFTTGNIVNEIWTALLESKIVIADCTGKNANVFYEIGLAHAIGKPTILITQKKCDVPFDLRHRRYLLYDLSASGMEIFKSELEMTIKTLLSTT
jgi:hypothetical protein